jgi:hypothetical protein
MVLVTAYGGSKSIKCNLIMKVVVHASWFWDACNRLENSSAWSRSEYLDNQLVPCQS